MHRTESDGSVSGAHSDGPPGSVLQASWLNAVQEEIAYVIEQAGLTILTEDTDTRTQLYQALTSMNLIGITATAGEINTACDGITATAAEINTICYGGLIQQKAKFIYKDTDEIYINTGVYMHRGTSNQIVYWNSQLTYQFQNLAASDWSYLYLDDSAIVTAGTNVITASQLIDSTTEPTWSDSKKGWYNGNDRCIFAVLTNGSSQILMFFHDGDFVFYETSQLSSLGAAYQLDDSYVDTVLTMPKFSMKAEITCSLNYVDTSTLFYVRTNGATGANHHIVGKVDSDVTNTYNTLNILTDSNQTIEIAYSAAGDNTVSIECNGWYFPDSV